MIEKFISKFTKDMKKNFISLKPNFLQTFGTLGSTLKKPGPKVIDIGLPYPEVLEIAGLHPKECVCKPTDGAGEFKRLLKMLKPRELHMFADLPDSEKAILASIAKLVTFEKGDILQIENRAAVFLHAGVPSEYDAPTFVLTKGLGTEARTIEVYASKRACFGASEFLLRNSALDRTFHGVISGRYRSSAVCFRGGAVLRFSFDAIDEKIDELPHFCRNLGITVAEKLYRRRTLWDNPSPLARRLGITLWHVVFAASDIVLRSELPPGTLVRKQSKRKDHVKFPDEWFDGTRGGCKVIGIPITLRSFAKCVDSDNASVGKVLKEIEGYEKDGAQIPLKKLTPNLWRIVQGYEEGMVYVYKRWAIKVARKSPASRLGRSAIQ